MFLAVCSIPGGEGKGLGSRRSQGEFLLGEGRKGGTRKGMWGEREGKGNRFLSLHVGREERGLGRERSPGEFL